MVIGKPSHMLEKHICSTNSANVLLAPSIFAVNCKVVHAMHTKHLFLGKDSAE